MTSKISDFIVSFLERHNAIQPEDKDIYIYGCDTAIYTFISTLGLLIIGFGFGKLLETLILIVIFYLNQTMGGGFHATTHFRCFLTMAVGVLIYIATFSLQIPMLISIIIGLTALLLLLVVPLVLHPNKQYLLVKQAKLKRHSRLVSASEVLSFIIILLFKNQMLAQACAISFALCAISRCTGLFLKK